MRKPCLLAAATCFLWAAPAAATPITLDLPFLARDFIPTAHSGPMPVDAVTGAFAITFENASWHLDVPGGVTVRDLNIAAPTAFAFLYNIDSDELVIGGGESVALFPSLDDFWLILTDASTAPRFREFVYAQAGTPGTFRSTHGTLSTTIPEPATTALLLVGLGVAAVRRRRGTI